MKTSIYLKTIFVLSLGGVLFAGYLSANKLLTGTCAFNESCPYFLGLPACWYGLGFFLIMFVTVCMALARVAGFKNSRNIIRVISFVGIIFAGQFVVQEILAWSSHPDYGLVLPTCVYGLSFYIAIFVLSLPKLKDSSRT